MLTVRHFRDLLENETICISDQCKIWQCVLDDGSKTIPEEACGKILVAIGQAQLLMTKKFQQFRGLVDTSEKSQGKDVTVNDLQGFWELMYLQVQDIHKKFCELDSLQKINWEVVSDAERQPLAALQNQNTANNPSYKLPSKSHLSAKAKERLAQAKAAMKRKESVSSENSV